MIIYHRISKGKYSHVYNVNANANGIHLRAAGGKATDRKGIARPGLNGRTLGHKRLYCAQCASNADIGKLLVPSSNVGSHLGISKTAANQSVSSLIRESIARYRAWKV